MSPNGEGGAEDGDGVAEGECLKNSAEVWRGNGTWIAGCNVVVDARWSSNPVEDFEELWERFKRVATGKSRR